MEELSNREFMIEDGHALEPYGTYRFSLDLPGIAVRDLDVEVEWSLIQGGLSINDVYVHDVLDGQQHLSWVDALASPIQVALRDIIVLQALKREREILESLIPA